MEQLLTIAETQNVLRLGRTKVLALIADGEIRAINIGTVWRVYAESVADYLDRQARQTRPGEADGDPHEH